MGSMAELAQLARLGIWPLSIGMLIALVCTPQLKPLRQLVWAVLFELLLTSRGVSKVDRHALLLDAARSAQGLTSTSVTTVTSLPPIPPASEEIPRIDSTGRVG